MYQLQFLILFSILWCITISAPSTSLPPLVNHKITTTKSTVSDFLKPETDTISVDGLNYLLRAAGNFFRPPLLIPDIPVGASHIDENIQSSSSSSSLPSNHKFSPSSSSSSLLSSSNYYIPLYSYENLDKNIKYDDEKFKSLLNIFPPDITNNNEPNYYEMLKPKKIPKKYSSTLKLINVKATTKNNDNENDNQLKNLEFSTISSLPAHNHRYTYEDSYLNLNNHQIPVVPDNVSQDHDAQESQHQENDDDIDDDDNVSNENNEKNEQEEQKVEENEKDEQQSQHKQLENYENEGKQHKNENSNKNIQIPINYNYDDRDRIEYQVHGHNGPKSYKFGYDTGKGKNRQYRFEERDNSGNVIGEYGYINKKGQLMVIKYSSDAERGFQIENMH